MKKKKQTKIKITRRETLENKIRKTEQKEINDAMKKLKQTKTLEIKITESKQEIFTQQINEYKTNSTYITTSFENTKNNNYTNYTQGYYQKPDTIKISEDAETKTEKQVTEETEQQKFKNIYDFTYIPGPFGDNSINSHERQSKELYKRINFISNILKYELAKI